MPPKPQTPTKILFRFHSNIFDEEMVETMWADIVDAKKGLYKLDNIPFYVPKVASGDVVFAEYDADEEMLCYRKTVKPSGNSTVQVVLIDETKEINYIRAIFEKLGCPSEKVNEGYFAMEIPAGADHEDVFDKLDELEEEEVIGYAVACLGENPR